MPVLLRMALIACMFFVSNSAFAQSRTADSLLNGALIGAAAGATSVVLFCHAMEPWNICLQPEPIIKGAAVGTGIGIAIDVLIRKRTTNGPTSRLSISPVVAPRSKGLHMALRF